MNQFILCRECRARNDPKNDYRTACGVCLHAPTVTPPAGTKHIVYSAVMDEETCADCRSQEGHGAADINRLMPIPNPRCTSLMGCRCFHIYESE